MSARLSEKHLHADAQHLVSQRAYDTDAFGFGGLDQALAKRRFQAVRDGLEGFQTFGGQDGILQTEVMGLTSDIARSGQPVQAVDAELGLVSQKVTHPVNDLFLADELCNVEKDRFRKALIQLGKCLADDFIKPLDIGDRHDAPHP